jgi:hypothetical protein
MGDTLRVAADAASEKSHALGQRFLHAATAFVFCRVFFQRVLQGGELLLDSKARFVGYMPIFG